ncbi:MAG: response regulator [Terracidiphilus sp.]
MSRTPRQKVLLVEDDPATREIIAMLLNENGYDVSAAANGLDALSQLKMKTPDLIISDLNMPEMSGPELLSIVHRRLPSVPTIAMSATHDFRRRMPDGVIADAFFAKGRCGFDELLDKVTELIRTRAVRQWTTNTLGSRPKRSPPHGGGPVRAALNPGHPR